MKVTQKKLDDGRVLLEAVADPREVNSALAKAHIGFANQMGMRPEEGKTIAQLAEESMGIKDLDSVVEGMALEFLVPFAIDKAHILPAFPSTGMASSKMRRDKSFSFRTTVLPKPQYELDSYDPVRIEVPAVPEADEAAIQEQMRQMVEPYAAYVADDPHPVAEGDTVSLKLESFIGEEPMPGLTADGRSYQVGVGYMPEGFDENLLGMEVGETKTFTFEGPDVDAEGNPTTMTVTCTATVLETQKKADVELTDEWVRTYMPFYTSVQDMHDKIKGQMELATRNQYEGFIRQAAADEISTRFSGKIDDAIYEAMSKNLISNLRQSLAVQGVNYDDYVEQQGGEQQFGMMMLMQTRNMLVQGYSLDAVYRHFGLACTDDDLREVCAEINPNNPAAVRRDLEANGRGFVLRESAERLRATKYLAEHAIITYKDPDQQSDDAETADQAE